MIPENVTPNQFLESLAEQMRELAQDNPDFIYTRQPGYTGQCSYLGASIKNPGVGQACIVGQALQNLGVPTEILKRNESQSAEALLYNFFYTDFPGYIDNQHYAGLDYTLMSQISVVQEDQDSGLPWSEAILHIGTAPERNL